MGGIAQRKLRILEPSVIRGAKKEWPGTKDAGLPFEEGLAAARAMSLKLVPSSRLKRSILLADRPKKVPEAVTLVFDKAVFNCWTGTMAAYVQPGKAFGHCVKSTDPASGQKWIFPVPKEYRREKNAILISEPGDYSIEYEGDSRVVHVEKCDIVLKFAEKNGVYAFDAKFGIPSGELLENELRGSVVYVGQPLNKPIPSGHPLATDKGVESLEEVRRTDRRVGPISIDLVEFRSIRVRINLVRSVSDRCAIVTMED